MKPFNDFRRAYRRRIMQRRIILLAVWLLQLVTLLQLWEVRP